MVRWPVVFRSNAPPDPPESRLVSSPPSGAAKRIENYIEATSVSRADNGVPISTRHCKDITVRWPLRGAATIGGKPLR